MLRFLTVSIFLGHPVTMRRLFYIVKKLYELVYAILDEHDNDFEYLIFFPKVFNFIQNIKGQFKKDGLGKALHIQNRIK